MLEASVALQIILPMLKLVCQPNLCSLPEYASLWELYNTDIYTSEDFSYIPILWDE